MLLSPTPQTPPQDKTELPVEQRSRAGECNVRVSTSRRWAYVPEGADDAYGSIRPCTNGEKKANVRCRILPTAVRPAGAVADFPTRQHKYSAAVPTTEAKEARAADALEGHLQRTGANQDEERMRSLVAEEGGQRLKLVSKPRAGQPQGPGCLSSSDAVNVSRSAGRKQ